MLALPSLLVSPDGDLEWATYPLEDLLPPDVLQPAVQIAHLLHDIIQLALVRALNLARLANHHIQVEPHRAVNTAAQPAAGARHILGCEAQAVLARVGGGEGEAAFCGAALGNDTVIVIEGLLDGDEDADVGFGGVGLELVVPDGGFIVAWG